MEVKYAASPFSVTGPSGMRGIGSVHAHLRIEALRVGAQRRVIGLYAEERQMIVAVVEGEGVFGGRADVIPARAELRAAGKIGLLFVRWGCPAAAPPIADSAAGRGWA